jgi:hypothetical protein
MKPKQMIGISDLFPKEKSNLPAKSSKNLNNFITGI